MTSSVGSTKIGQQGQLLASVDDPYTSFSGLVYAQYNDTPYVAGLSIDGRIISTPLDSCFPAVGSTVAYRVTGESSDRSGLVTAYQYPNPAVLVEVDSNWLTVALP